MSTIRKINVSEIQGYNPNAILPNGTLVSFDDGSGIWKLRMHDGVTSGGIAVGELPASFDSITFSGDNSVQTTAFTGLTDTLDSVSLRGAITSSTVTVGSLVSDSISGGVTPVIGGTAQSGNPSSGYGGPLAIFAQGDFTEGLLSDVQVGWIVSDTFGWSATVTERGQYGYPGAITLNDNWSQQAPYTYRSPDYSPAVPNNLTISSGSSTWTLTTSGSVTFPNGTVQSSGYQLVSAPMHSTGAIGDKIGMVAYDTDYHYYCKADYTDGMSDIWVRVAWTGTTW